MVEMECSCFSFFFNKCFRHWNDTKYEYFIKIQKRVAYHIPKCYTIFYLQMPFCIFSTQMTCSYKFMIDENKQFNLFQSWISFDLLLSVNTLFHLSNIYTYLCMVYEYAICWLLFCFTTKCLDAVFFFVYVCGRYGIIHDFLCSHSFKLFLMMFSIYSI